MVQMAAVGENTGNLDNTMETVAMSYGMDAGDRTNALISSIQPVTTLVMGALVGFIAIALISTMYSVMDTL
jgi:type IV pilus assembly protein PilC